MTETQRRALRLLARPGAYAYRRSDAILWSIGTQTEKWRKVSSDTIHALAVQELVALNPVTGAFTITGYGRDAAARRKEKHA